jgi:hypothetical protein
VRSCRSLSHDGAPLRVLVAEVVGGPGAGDGRAGAVVLVGAVQPRVVVAVLVVVVRGARSRRVGGVRRARRAGGVVQELLLRQDVRGAARGAGEGLRPQHGAAPRPAHRLEHLLLLHVPVDRHLLLRHVDLHVVHALQPLHRLPDLLLAPWAVHVHAHLHELLPAGANQHPAEMNRSDTRGDDGADRLNEKMHARSTEETKLTVIFVFRAGQIDRSTRQAVLQSSCQADDNGDWRCKFRL